MRYPDDLTPTPLARARVSRGEIPYDLTVGNPTVCDLPYPRGLLDPLRDPAALIYRPDAQGLRSAREAIAAEYEAHGVTVDPDRVVLAASSSEAYSFLFKLLCPPGESVLVPVPSYPLFEHLAALDGLRALPYHLDPAHDWQPRPLETGSAAHARAAIVVHPNNPTGSWMSPEGIETLARRDGAGERPLIVDEVFLDYPLSDQAPARTFASRRSGLTFTLSGLSKSRGLPQLKLSWIVVNGPEGDVDRALSGLTFIADNYLSVGTPIQDALPEILARSAPVQEAIRARCRENLATARLMGGRVPGVAVLPPAAGWSVVLRYPSVIGEEALALTLLEKHGVAVQPGYFFDFEKEGFLVLSLLPPPGIFEAGLGLTLEMITATL